MTKLTRIDETTPDDQVPEVGFRFVQTKDGATAFEDFDTAYHLKQLISRMLELDTQIESERGEDHWVTVALPDNPTDRGWVLMYINRGKEPRKYVEQVRHND